MNDIGGHITLILPDPQQRADCFRALTDDSGRIIRSFARADEFLDAADDVAGGVVLLHWAQSDATSGQALLRNIAMRGDLVALVVAERLSMEESRAILRTGARDLIAAPIDPDALRQTVAGALDAWADFQHFHCAQSDAQARLGRLTPRELDILEAMAEGLGSKEIARRFDLSPRTVEVHRANIMRRSEARSFAALLRMKFMAEMGADALFARSGAMSLHPFW